MAVSYIVFKAVLWKHLGKEGSLKRIENLIPASTKGTASANTVVNLLGRWLHVVLFFRVMTQNDLSCLGRSHSWWWGLGIWGYQLWQLSPHTGKGHSSVWQLRLMCSMEGDDIATALNLKYKVSFSEMCSYQKLVYLHFINSLILSLHVFTSVHTCVLGCTCVWRPEVTIRCHFSSGVTHLGFWGKNSHWLEPCWLGWTSWPLSPRDPPISQTFSRGL